jgi:hypothetical protein
MKKILLLIVSGLLIACMAGSAMASVSLDLGTRQVDLAENDPVTVSLSATASPYYKMVLTLPDGVSGYILPDSGSPIPTFASLTGPTSGYQFFEITDAQANIYHTGKLYLSGSKEGEVSVSVYEGTSTEPSATWTLRAYSTVDTKIPEFPTVALPVAAILGLVFIFGRKKEGL